MLAGPGSGKTKTLTVKVARMLAEDVRPPRGLACITYNTECARELRWRLDQLGVQESRNVFIGTIHSFCLKHVVLPYAKLAGVQLPEELAVASPSDQARLFERALFQVKDESEYPPAWRTRCDKYRRTYLDRAGPGWLQDQELAQLIETYEELLRNEGLIDFEDMVLVGLRLIEQHSWVRQAVKARFPILVVDEYQDLGLPLHRIVLSLCFGGGVRLLAVGDPDQSIYGFTGAQPELLEKLSEKEGIERILLPFNYRSGKTIIEASEIALGETRGYKAKGSEDGTVDFYECPEGLKEQAEVICETLIPQALDRRSGRKLGDVAVLYLDRNDGDVIAEYVAACGMKSIRIDKGAPYTKTPLTRWLEDCAKWCSGGWKKGEPRLSVLGNTWFGFNKNDRSARARLYLRRSLVRFLFSHRFEEMLVRDWLSKFYSECLSQTLGQERTLRHEKEALENLLDVCSEGGKLEDLTLAVFAGQAGSPDHLNLITLHSAKGLEFDVVIMMGMDQGKIPSWAASSEAREPRRLFYVGLTRARHEVHMTYSGWTSNRAGRIFRNGPSEFLLEVRQKLIAQT